MRVEQPGPDTFLQLYDTPDTYAGAGGDNVVVKITEDGLEFSTPSPGVTPVSIDLSSQCDGVTTLFNLGVAVTGVLQVTITGWPPNGALRPTVDFTVPDASHIQFTSQVSAPEVGTTLIVLAY